MHEGSKRGIQMFAGTLAFLMFVYDIIYAVELVAGVKLVAGAKLDHIPFLYPIAFAFLVGVIEVMDRQSRGPTPEEHAARVRSSDRASAFVPEHLSVERAVESAID